ncbi:MAG: hypothetical protein AAFQ50_11975 [Pseudomonadota bacterium]
MTIGQVRANFGVFLPAGDFSMSDYYVAFYRGKGTFADKVVKFATRSPFSHCELIRSDTKPRRGETHTCISASGRDGGVRIKDIELKDPKWDIYAVPFARPDTWDRAAAELGKPYELWTMFASQLFNFRRNSRNRWYCSELVAHALRLRMPHAKSPGDLPLGAYLGQYGPVPPRVRVGRGRG